MLWNVDLQKWMLWNIHLQKWMFWDKVVHVSMYLVFGLGWLPTIVARKLALTQMDIAVEVIIYRLIEQVSLAANVPAYLAGMHKCRARARLVSGMPGVRGDCETLPRSMQCSMQCREICKLQTLSTSFDCDMLPPTDGDLH